MMWLTATGDIVTIGGTPQQTYYALPALGINAESPTIGWGTPPASATHLRIKIDWNNIVPETYEPDNILTVPVPAPSNQGLPDFAIQSVTFNSVLAPAVTIINQGTASSPYIALPNGERMEWIDANGAIVYLPESGQQVLRYALNALEPGETVITGWGSPPSGAVSLHVLIDQETQVEESNENNNGIMVPIPTPGGV